LVHSQGRNPEKQTKKLNKIGFSENGNQFLELKSIVIGRTGSECREEHFQKEMNVSIQKSSNRPRNDSNGSQQIFHWNPLITIFLIRLLEPSSSYSDEILAIIYSREWFLESERRNHHEAF
jgi:hypothetical protein